MADSKPAAPAETTTTAVPATTPVVTEKTVTEHLYQKPVEEVSPVEHKPEAPAATPPEAPKETPKVEPAKPDAPKTEATPPEGLALKLPEGSVLNQERVEKIASYAKEQGLSQAEAQRILERENDAVKTYVGDLDNQIKETAKAWNEEMRNDPDFGGARLKETAFLAEKALNAFGSPALRKQLDETGFGDHPELVRLFARMGRAMSNDKTVLGGQPPEPEKKTPAQMLYDHPTSQQMKG